MRVAVLFNRVEPGAPPDEGDVLAQVEAVSAALAALGHRPEPLACGLDLDALAGELDRRRPDAAFNLVESLGGHERLLHLVPALLDVLGIPYTGCPTEALFLTTGKLLAKERLAAAGLPTPSWRVAGEVGLRGPAPAGGGGAPFAETLPEAFIVKPVWEHGSVGLGDEAILPGGDLEAVSRRLAEGSGPGGGPLFAEAYVDGRELNLSLLAGASDGPAGGSPREPQVLPPAEIRFTGYPRGKPRIVSYRAKWDSDSFEYRHTVRSFDFPAADGSLLAETSELARRCWRLFGLRGYARVDFRVDVAGRPWILEVNANPCLSLDAGFAAALEPAGLTYAQAVERILAGAATMAPAPGRSDLAPTRA